ncbi:MAG: hypothetical protein ABF608_07055 [Sporolactobacillus sp.]
MKSNENKSKSQKRKPNMSKHELRELMGQFDQMLERRHGALRRKGR